MNKITIAVSELKSALPGFSKVINKKTTLPVLGCVLFKTNKQGQLQLTATNLDDYVSRTIEMDGVFQAVIPFDSLNKIVKGCAITATLQIEALKEEVRITYPVGGTRLTERIDCLPVPEFPVIPEPEWNEPVTAGQDFKQALREALDSASTDESRCVLNSAFVDDYDLSATDETRCHPFQLTRFSV
jgi:DNA polymerase III sliding clamp (beta) subunit (PCNA family)